MQEIYITIYLVSVFGCFCATGERLHLEMNKEKTNSLWSDLIWSCVPLYNTYYCLYTFICIISEIVINIKKNGKLKSKDQ